jgi:hypothetical protein
MALTSPGVEVSVIDESFYVPSDAGTTPLLIVTSSKDKLNGAGSGTAAGTQSANANQVYLISSQRELTETFGDPIFYTDASGNPINGYELNEYGLQAAYSFLGIANKAFVMRANIDLSELIGSSTAPSASPSDGTYWLDLASSVYGIFEWSRTNQAFTTITPKLITSTSDLVGNTSTGAPKTSFGTKGDYAVNTTHVTNKMYYKNDSNSWVQLGSSAWHNSHPTIEGTATSGNITSGHSIIINGVTVTSTAISRDTFATTINNAGIPGVTAAVDSTTGKFEIYINGLAYGDSSATNSIRISNNSGTILTDLGITAGLYNGPEFLQAAHTARPEWKTADDNRPNGSVWFKTTTPNSGADISVKLYNSSAGSFATVDAPFYATNHSAIYNLDPTNGGSSITTGSLYTQYNVTEQSVLGQFDTTPALGDFQVFRYEGGETVIQSKTTNPQFTAGETFKVQESLKNQEALNTAKTVTMISGDGSTLGDAEDFVTAFSTAGFTNLEASVIATGDYRGAVQIKHKLGGEFRMWDVSGTPLVDAGFSTGTAHSYGTYTANSTTLIDNLYDVPAGDTEDSTTPAAIMASNWKRLSYTASSSAPTNEPANGTVWYNTNLEADIMVHNGSTWVGYRNLYSLTDPNGPQFSATEPTTQSDGTPLVNNDLWIDTSDLENYPKLYKYDTSATVTSTNTSNGVAVTTTTAKWVLVDNTDQTTEDGIVFADARWHTTNDKSADGNTGAGTASTIKDLLSDNFLDPDAPNPALYPKSILLFNTRRSGYNVKEYRNNYITADLYPGSGSSGLGNTRAGNESVTGYYQDRWVTKSANNDNGSGTFGRKAQRKVIVAQLKSEIDTNQAIREDQRGFNVIACPGYPEVIANMINLNTDRNNTAFVIGDTPMRLRGNATSITNWANNTAGATDNGEEGLVSASDYLGVFYPSGRTTDNSGNNIVVPPSHMMLRTFANNDNIGFPWFAPAGTRRGVVDNATAVGYIDAEGEFDQIALTESVRDSMFDVKINPITFFSGAGIVNFGNLTKTSRSSALDRINVSRLTTFLRTQLDAIAKPFIFEPNDELTRNEIRQAVESFLLELVGQRALYDFLVVCDDTNNTPTRIDRNELYVDIAIEPVKSVEFIYIPLRIKNTGEIANLGN